MKNVFLLIILSSLCSPVHSQENQQPVKKGTIRVKKQGHIYKVIFDDINYRLLGIDTYGNIMDTAVIEFKMFTTIKGIAYKTSTTSPNLSREMQAIIDLRDNRTTLFFKEIKVRDFNGTIISAPDFSYTFPYKREEEY